MPEFETRNIGDQETDDFIKAPPRWLIRNGMILMIVVFIILIVGAYFMPYPDTIEGKGVIRAYQSSLNTYSYSIQVDVLPAKATYIKKGQQCFIKVEEYPYQKYGLLTGTVSEINNLHNDSAYTVNISIGKKLLTTKMLQIPDKPKYFIDASIVIRHRRLLDRLISRHSD
ncbi:hypothetical protein SNE26_07285 [Mucilaginibacter sp. cycad4]|uniref:hypothetical protein n=1 Tax=Mucilaginibacter sp. cycad4 TaxID=3342096 RepID=UPI002AABB5B3|nr:hypothetical protein [Mucilaginibacter gossypii]WPV01575.1 hypothetical protein SNE26_07285 [Mucilaginibacter gossypii]